LNKITNSIGIQYVERTRIISPRERNTNSYFYIFVFINLKFANIFNGLITWICTDIIGGA